MHGNHQGTSSHVQQNDAAKRPNSANSSSLESRENREQVTFGGSSMDLGIRGRWALVCAASKGLGKGCATALVTEGVNVVITARHADVLEATARELRHINPSVDVKAVVGDIATEDGRARALGACPQVDILINNAGGPPPGDFRDWDRNAWIAALDANMLAPIELMKATVDQMAERGFGRVVNITSGAVKSPISVLGLSNGARTGLTGFVAGLARQPQLARRNVTINNLLPGTFDTDRLRTANAATAKSSGQDVEAVTQARRSAVPAQRFGSAEEFGATCAFLCSVHAGYVTAQNILMDGGLYPGTF
jgi:3-oxoacyl-[acyl-carrier protein] reductase